MMKIARRLYALLLLVFPRDYRRTHASDLMDFFEDAYVDARLHGGMAGAAGYFLRAAWDVLRHGFRERWLRRRSATNIRWFFPSLQQDIAYGLRSIRRSPAFAVVTVVTVGLGVGANSAMFSVVHAVMLQPPPYEEPDRLVTVSEANRAQGMRRVDVSYPNFVAWQEQQRSFVAMAAVSGSNVLLRGDAGEEAERVSGIQVSPQIFSVLRRDPALGRPFSEDDTRVGSNPVVILSHALWQTRFGGDPLIIGRPLSMVGREATIVGVMPADFTFPNSETQLWFPIVPEGNVWRVRAAHILTVVARLAPRVTPEQANQEINLIAENVERAYPGEDPAHAVMIQPFDNGPVDNVRVALWVLLGAVGTVLFIACVNTANLSLARATGRMREIAMRRALGANRTRIVRQLLTEGMVLAVVAGTCGLLLSIWVTGYVAARVPADLPGSESIRVSGVVLLFTLGVSVLTGLLFSMVPALHASRSNLVDDLKGTRSSTSSGTIRLRQALVIAEVALSCVLVVGAGLLINSFWRIVRVDPGFDPERLVTMTVSLSGVGFNSSEEVIEFYRDLPQRLEALPVVEAVSAVNALPVSGGDSRGTITIEGHTFADGTAPTATYRRITPGYFHAMGIPVIQGREFDARDTGESGFITVIDQNMANQYWPDVSPIGMRIKVGPAEHEPWLTIVGVAGNVRNEGLEASNFDTYEPHPQRPWSTMNVVVRAAADPGVVASSVRAGLFDMHPDIAVYGTNTMFGRIRASLAARRFQTALLGSFAALALLLAMVGIYGVMSYLVAQRERELGIRIALGAPGTVVRNTVVRDGMLLAVVGVVIGIGLSVFLTRSIRTMVYDVSLLDPATIAIVSAGLLLVAAGASLGPAHRATHVDPVSLTRG